MYWIDVFFIDGSDRVLKDVSQQELYRFIESTSKISGTDYITFNKPEDDTGIAINLSNILLWKYRPQKEEE